MSALEIKKRKKTSSFHTCVGDTHCSRSARFSCTILGWPVGSICDAHRKEWIAAWAASLG